MSTKELHQVAEQVILFVEEIISELVLFWSTIPHVLQVLITILALVALVNIFASIVKSAIVNRAAWKPKPDSELMFSFAAGSGQFQRKRIYRDAHSFLFDKRWSYFSFAGLAYRLGNVESRSRITSFICSLCYLPLAIIGMAEMVVRFFAGIIVFFALNLIYFLILAALWLINLVLMPIFNVADKLSWIPQHCPKCYATFKLPVFECPKCGAHHAKLYPGRCGLIWAKCSCGKFISCSSLSKRKMLKSYCPKCGHELAGSSVDALTIQIVGGNSSGKTAYIAAFQHCFLERAASLGVSSLTTSPQNDFLRLEKMYQSGQVEKSDGNTVQAFHILHNDKWHSDSGIIIYDVPDEIILSEQYERNPLNFAYSNGVIIIIDPISIAPVRKECAFAAGPQSIKGFSDDSAEEIIVHFINKYSEVAGRSAKKMSDMPIAVVISKTDLPPINQHIGIDAIRATLSSDNASLSGFEEVRNNACRNYLSNIGLSNALNNLESVFSRVAYFPVSSMGHFNDTSPFSPQNVITPIGWLASQCQSSIQGLLSKIEEKE